MTKTEYATEWMEDTANDDSHGYSQYNRWGPDYDCSSAVITAWKKAGVLLTCTYTGNMIPDMLAKGFKNVSGQVDFTNAKGMARGDVLWKDGHTGMYCGNGNEVEAACDENGGIIGQHSGDQTGREFLIQPYQPVWTVCLRYKDSGDDDSMHEGSTGKEVKDLQTKLIALGYSCGAKGADGVFGKDTTKAVKAFQKDHGIKQTGIVNDAIMAVINEAYRRIGWKMTGTATCGRNNVTLRKEAASKSKSLGILNVGQRFEIDGTKSGNFTHAYVTGIGICWILTRYTEPDLEWKMKGTATCANNNIVVRAMAKVDDNVIGTLNRGQRFEVDGKKANNFVHIKVAGLGTGYMHKKYVKYD